MSNPLIPKGDDFPEPHMDDDDDSDVGGWTLIDAIIALGLVAFIVTVALGVFPDA